MKQKGQTLKLTKKLTKDGDLYEIDPVDQPGAPIVGRGYTPLEALVFFLCRNPQFNLTFVDETGEFIDENGIWHDGWNNKQERD
jgi:hypothetical protein